MSTRARKRLMKEYKKQKKKEKMGGVSAMPLSGNIMQWQAMILGPDGTNWEGGTFELHLEFSEQYPIEAPKVVFKSVMFHPNIYKDGKICLDILQKKWSPQYDMEAVLTSIQSLLSDPNTDSPANPHASNLFDEDREEYIKEVRKCVENSWVYRERKPVSKKRKKG